MNVVFALCIAPLLAVFLLFAIYILLTRQRTADGGALPASAVQLQFAMVLLLLGVTLMLVDIIKHWIGQ